MSGDDDYLLALQLQEFNDSFDDDLPQIVKESQHDKENKPQKSLVKSKATYSSLVDPSWETIDPTPDIHALFIQFNKTFFWEKLNAVEVRWSPRMTLCAGVCVYQGRAGMCSIRLSLPLLKLRPRKDLVETLLHEMIHAYLFVTHNNRDRDGHGPEFHKHMYRINQQAGTKISVYHSFHDEVKSYQQHWWRCDGPCQNRPPFFGMVKRSMNRAPGPSDNWHADHQATCGGNFIKVHEPEGFSDKKTNKDKDAPSNSKGHISNFFPIVKKGGVPKNVFGFGNVNNSSSSPAKRMQGSSLNNVVGFKDLNGRTQPKKNPTDIWKGQGKKLGSTGNKRPAKSGGVDNSGRPKNFGKPGRAGMLANRGGGTLVITAKDGRSSGDGSQPVVNQTDFTPFGGTGIALGTKSSTAPAIKPSSMCETSLKSATPQQDPSRWIPKSTSPKRPMESMPSASKTRKTESVIETMVVSDDSTEPKHAMVRCPLCFIEVSEIDVNGHLDECLTRQADSETVKADSKDKTEPCPVCNKQVSSAELQIHVGSCLSNSLDEDDMNEMNADDTDEKDVKKDDKGEKRNCPVCDKLIPVGDLNDHLENCDGLQCSQECIMLDDESDEEEEEAVGGSPRKNPSGGKLYPCPICTQLFSESSMNVHLDECMLP